MPIEKGIIYIKLVNAPLTVEGNAKHNTYSDWIYHRTESLVKFNAQLLVKAFSNKVSFISCNRADKIMFDVKYQFFAHYILPHRHNPLGVPKSLGNSAWLSEGRKHGGEAIFWVGFDDGIFSTGFHGMKV